MQDTAFQFGGVSAAPLGYTVPGTGEVLVKQVYAHIDGTSAAGAFYPCVRIKAPGGQVMAEYITPTLVAAGASADVTWFPGVKEGAPANPVAANELDYVEITSPVTVNVDSAHQVTIIQGNPVTYDGVTRVRVEVYSPIFDIISVGGGNLLADLWIDSTDLGVIASLNSDASNSDLGTTFFGVRYLTPSAGSHAFALKGWTSTGVHGNSFGAGAGGAATDMPGYLRVSG